MLVFVHFIHPRIHTNVYESDVYDFAGIQWIGDWIALDAVCDCDVFMPFYFCIQHNIIHSVTCIHTYKCERACLFIKIYIEIDRDRDRKRERIKSKDFGET